MFNVFLFDNGKAISDHSFTSEAKASVFADNSALAGYDVFTNF